MNNKPVEILGTKIPDRINDRIFNPVSFSMFIRIKKTGDIVGLSNVSSMDIINTRQIANIGISSIVKAIPLNNEWEIRSRHIVPDKLLVDIERSLRESLYSDNPFCDILIVSSEINYKEFEVQKDSIKLISDGKHFMYAIPNAILSKMEVEHSLITSGDGDVFGLNFIQQSSEIQTASFQNPKQITSEAPLIQSMVR